MKSNQSSTQLRVHQRVCSIFTNERGFIRTYAYASDGTITAASIDREIVGQAPENLSLYPAGRVIYSIDSFDDTITQFEVN